MSGAREVVVYRERLMPRWWAWLVPGSFVLMLSIAYGAALGVAAGWATAAVTGVLAVLLMWLTAPTIAVVPGSVIADGARLPGSSIGSVEVLDRDGMAAFKGPGTDARMFLVVRPWSAPGGVVIRLDDAEDPHPSWLLTSRHPSRLGEAIAATMGEPTQTEDA
jgi:hypothetical protein